MSDVQNLAGQRFALIANFPPNFGPSELHSGGLAHLLRSAGAEVITASEIGRSYARISLIYRTRRLFAATRNNLHEAISDATQVVIYASALKTDNIEKPRWRSRRMEEWRRFRLAFMAARSAKKCLFVFDADWRQKPFWITLSLAGSLFFIMPIRIANLRRGPSWLLEQITGISAPSPSKEVTADTSFELAQLDEHDTDNRRLSPLGLQRAMRGIKDQALRADLDQIRQISTELVGACRQFSTLAVLAVPHPVEKMAAANICDQSKLSRFMHHYRTSLQPRAALPMGADSDDNAFLDWYLHSKTARRASPILPVPSGLVSCEKGVIAAARTLLDFAHRVEQVDFLSPELQQYFADPVIGNTNNLSRLELIMAVAIKLPLTSRMLIENPWCADEIRFWFANTICPIAPSLRVFSTISNEIISVQPSVEIAGIVDGDSGLATNAAMSAAAFQSLGLQANLRHISDLNNPRALAIRPPRRRLVRSVILHHVNADRVPQQILARALAVGNKPLHIGYLLWELDKIPQSHALAGELLDDIWAPTRFVQDIYERAYGRKVVNIGKAISLPQVEAANLEGYGISRASRVFLTCFDTNSSVERKNPLAAVRAFLQAFPRDNSVRMIVKATPPGPNAWGDPHQQMKTIRRLARKDRRVVVIEDTLPFYNLIALIKRADCIVSTHRAEGFGYIPAYGLNFAKPVIVTDYSGTQDFCTPDTAYPIPCNLVTTQTSEIIAPVSGAVWADINVAETAMAMRQVLDNPDDAKQRGLAGQRLMKNYYSPEAHAARYLKRLKQLGAVA